MDLNNKMHRILCALLCAVLLLAGCADKTEKNTEPTLPDPMTLETLTLESRYVTLRYPKRFEETLKHQEVIQDSVAMEIFSMAGEGRDWELFRIYFNAPDMGALVGYLTKGADQIPVTYSICEYEDSDFPDEETKRSYNTHMVSFDVVMNAVCEDPQYSQDRRLDPVETQTVHLTYWDTELPENVFWEEREVDGLYRTVFYGIIRDERVDLYSIGLGEMEADYSLGYFTVNGETRPVQVRIFDLPENGWPESEIEIANRMLESVNPVVDAILAHQNFSEEPEAVPIEETVLEETNP